MDLHQIGHAKERVSPTYFSQTQSSMFHLVDLHIIMSSSQLSEAGASAQNILEKPQDKSQSLESHNSD